MHVYSFGLLFFFFKALWYFNLPSSQQEDTFLQASCEILVSCYLTLSYTSLQIKWAVWVEIVGMVPATPMLMMSSFTHPTWWIWTPWTVIKRKQEIRWALSVFHCIDYRKHYSKLGLSPYHSVHANDMTVNFLRKLIFCAVVKTLWHWVHLDMQTQMFYAEGFTAARSIIDILSPSPESTCFLASGIHINSRNLL